MFIIWTTSYNMKLYHIVFWFPFQFSSVAQLCQTLCDPIDCSMPALPVHHQLPGLSQTHVHRVGMPSNHLILCRPPLLLPSVFPSIRVFSNESVLHIRWSKFWSFSFSISLSDEYSGLISFRIDWFDLLAVQELLIVLSTFSYALWLFVYLLWRASSFLRKRAASHSLIF